MSGPSKIGAFITSNTIEIVEVENSSPTKSISIPIKLDPPAQDAAMGEEVAIEGAEDFTEGMSGSAVNDQVAQEIKIALEKEGISATDVCLSLPTKDIIFRSFIIPWMKSTEIEETVQFEAKKYIPFSLDEVIYSIAPITKTEDNVKQLKIIFVAIKKTTIKYYKDVFSKAGLNVEIIEPAAMGLMRSLILKDLLPPTGLCALLDDEDSEGKIIVIENQIPQFVREFQLTSLSQEGEGEEQRDAGRLVKETAISVEYYARQNPNEEIESLIYFSKESNQDIADELEQELGLEVAQIDLSAFSSNGSIQTLQQIHAFGTCLYNTVQSNAQFILIEEEEVSDKVELKSFAPETQRIDFKKIIPVAGVCAAIIAGGYIFSGKGAAEIKKDVKAIESKLGKDKDKSASSLKKKSSLITKNLRNFKTIRMDSDVAYFLQFIPNSMSEGMWLEKIDILYPKTEAGKKGKKKTSKKKKTGKKSKKGESKKSKVEDVPLKPKVEIEITGYVYHEEVGQQFNLANDLARILRSDSKFSAYFEDIKFQTKITKMEEHQVTSFTVSCK